MNENICTMYIILNLELSTTLSNEHLWIKTKLRIENIFIFYGFDSVVFCSIDLLLRTFEKICSFILKYSVIYKVDYFEFFKSFLEESIPSIALRQISEQHFHWMAQRKSCDLLLLDFYKLRQKKHKKRKGKQSIKI